MPWWIRPQFIDVVRLRRAALRYSAHGWDVTPGACLLGDRFTCHRPGCPTVGCHPALEQWQEAASCDSARVEGWWRRLPHTVLLATGRAFDVLEVPAHLGLRVLGLTRLHGHVLGPARLPVVGPLATTPAGRWMFLVRPTGRVRPELDGHSEVLHHGPGSWIPAPPTRLPQGRVRWAVTPEEVHWRLPDSYAVQALLVDAIAATTPIGWELPRGQGPTRPAAPARSDAMPATRRAEATRPDPTPPDAMEQAAPRSDQSPPAAPPHGAAEPQGGVPLDGTPVADAPEPPGAGTARAGRGRRSPAQRTPVPPEADPSEATATESTRSPGAPSCPGQRATPRQPACPPERVDPGQQPEAAAPGGHLPGAADGATRLPSVPRQASTARRAA